MSSSTRDLLVRGIAAAKAKDIDEARFYLEWVLRTDANRQQKIKAWWWLSEISDDPAEKRDLLENILAHEPGHVEARRSLAILDGRLDPDDIIDPNRLPATPQQPESPQPARTQQFTCPQCGGQMTYNSDTSESSAQPPRGTGGQTLICPHCHHQLNLTEAIEAGDTVEEQDFVVALATAKGHTHAVTTQSFQCQGCGASFVVGPAVLSVTCPYCASAHVMEHPENRQLIPPEGIVPFVLTQEQAHNALCRWLKAKKLRKESRTATPSGLYVPVWTFDAGGEIQWREKAVDTRHAQIKTISQTSSRPIFFDDVLVPASRKFTNLADEFKHYQLDQLVPYEPGYLADWPAETYQSSAANASLKARQQAYARAQQQARELTAIPFTKSEEMTFSSANITIESFKLILLPVWLTYYYYRDKKYNVFINGQTGRIKGATPHKLRSWWDKFWGND